MNKPDPQPKSDNQGQPTESQVKPVTEPVRAREMNDASLLKVGLIMILSYLVAMIFSVVVYLPIKLFITSKIYSPETLNSTLTQESSIVAIIGLTVASLIIFAIQVAVIVKLMQYFLEVELPLLWAVLAVVIVPVAISIISSALKIDYSLEFIGFFISILIGTIIVKAKSFYPEREKQVPKPYSS